MDGQPYTFDANGNLLATGVMTNTWDAANRLTAVSRQPSAVSFMYNGLGDRVGQTVGATITHLALDITGPERGWLELSGDLKDWPASRLS